MKGDTIEKHNVIEELIIDNEVYYSIERYRLWLWREINQTNRQWS